MSPDAASAAALAAPRRPAAGAALSPGWLAAVAVAPMAAAGAAQFALPLVRARDGRVPDLTVYADDFFYYAVIAARVLAGEGLSFDGLTTTNGFHPLWLAVLVALGAIAPPRSAAFFALLQATLAVLTLATVLGCHRMLRRTFGFAAAPALAATMFVSINVLLIAATGMEPALALPLIVFAIGATARLVDAPGPGRAACAALMAALAILARLDAAILFALVGVAALVAVARAGRLAALLAPRTLAGLVLGAAPLAAYVAANLAAFGAIVPVSGRAKQLAEGLFVNPLAFHFFRGGAEWLMTLGPLDTSIVVATVPALLILALILVSARRRTILAAGRASIAWALLAFPLVYYPLLAFISDWMVWGWYMYAIVPATAVAAAALVELAQPLWRKAPSALPAAIGLVGAILILHVALRPAEPNQSIVHAARALAAFAADHPGRYAMGDRAGAFGFLTDRQIVQTEGLVGDAVLLAAIRARRPLLAELAARGVDYYVGSDMARDGGCWLAEEPHQAQAGPRSPRMTARLCRAPVFTVAGRDGIAIQVFDLRAD